MIKYKVNLGYYDFVFDDAGTAVDFALTAKRFNIEDSLHVNVEFVDVDDEPEIFEDEEAEDPEEDE